VKNPQCRLPEVEVPRGQVCRSSHNASGAYVSLYIHKVILQLYEYFLDGLSLSPRVPLAQDEFDISGEIAKGSFGVVFKAVRKSGLYMQTLLNHVPDYRTSPCMLQPMGESLH